MELDLRPNRIKGPGFPHNDSDGSSSSLPFVFYVGRLYNHTFVPGVVRVKQGAAAP